MNWKVVAFVLGVMIVLLSTNLYFQTRQLDFNGFEIREKQFEDIKQVTGDEFTICKLSENKCVVFNRLK